MARSPSRTTRAYATGLGVSLAAALVVALRAVDVQSGRIPDAEGHGWAFSTLFGPDLGSGLNAQGWAVVTTPGELTSTGMARYVDLLATHLVLDAVLALVVAALLLVLVRALCWSTWWRRTGVAAVAALLATSLLGDLAAWLVLRGAVPAGVVVILTTLRWGSTAAVGVLVLLRLIVPTRAPPGRVTPRARLLTAARAVRQQRFSYLPVIAIAVLSIPSGAAILEQLPDAMRGWVGDGPTGARHATAAVLSTLALSTFLLAVGRRRTVFAYRHLEGAPAPTALVPTALAVGSRTAALRRQAYMTSWLVVPAVALLSAAVVTAAGQGRLVLLPRLAVFVGTPLVIVLGSWACRWLWSRRPDWDRPDQPPVFTPQEAYAVGIAGTVAGLAAVVVGGLSLLRAFAPMIILPDVYLVSPGADAEAVRRRAIGLMVLGGLAVVAPWVVVAGSARLLGGPDRSRFRDRRTAGGARLRHLVERLRPVRVVRILWRGRAVLLLLAATTVFLGLGLSPRFAAWIGLAATATLALGSLAGMISALALVLQDRPTAEVFRLLRFRRTPLVSLVLLTVVLVGVLGGRGGLHDVDAGTPATSAVDARPTLDAAFRGWFDGARSCQVELDDVVVRPMILVAAEGGGIRAAYWTVRGLQAIDDETCAGRSTFFSAGASGGSVGLTVARFSGSDGQVHSREAVDAVKQMARPEILSEAADGTFVRDLVYGATGVPVPRLGERDPFAWQDRARLIERGWAGSGEWGTRRFLPDGSSPSPATGQLILNSTSVRDSCRVWLSQVRLSAVPGDQTPSFDPELSCDKVPGVAPRTIDLFSAYGPYGAGAGRGTCLGQVSAATTALLTARFPYVTPSGVVGPCPDRRVVRGKQTEPYWPKTQLVDGGYLENSGLGTVTDLSAQWLALVREHNREALATARSASQSGSTGSAAKPVLVVPLVVFLANGERNVTQPALDAAPTSELAVPVRTILGAGSALDGNDAQLARTRDALALSGFCPQAAGSTVCAQLDRWFPSRVVVVDRVTQPEVAAPLGWVLSGASIASLDTAIAAQLKATCASNQPRRSDGPATAPPADERQASCRTGYATLGDLQRYLATPAPAGG